MKAITGTPISMEGKTSACAHFSPVGNIAAACADLWSNESVQNIKLLSGMAPTAYMEQLEYDTRLMNKAVEGGKGEVLQLQKLFINSDIYFDPQAFVLSPEIVIEVSKEIIKGKNPIDATKRGCLKALALIREAIKVGRVMHDPKEDTWFDTLQQDIETIPIEESAFIDLVLPTLDETKLLLNEYGL
jgi:methanol--5-hydroxybenzimidazolylcobamide Co-methyltransferase